MSRLKLNYRDLSKWVRYVIKTRQDNNITDCIGSIYIKNEIELSWPVGPSAAHDENKMG